MKIESPEIWVGGGEGFEVDLVWPLFSAFNMNLGLVLLLANDAFSSFFIFLVISVGLYFPGFGGLCIAPIFFCFSPTMGNLLTIIGSVGFGQYGFGSILC